MKIIPKEFKVALVVTLISIWLAYTSLVYNKNEIRDVIIIFSPLIVLAVFGIYCFGLLLYRTLTFNDCNEAAEELKRDIIEARSDLTRQGFKFRE